jgi:carbonic anhydrase/acetyltransferase-like protein (isoleucine patch superfamily)
MRPDLTEIHEHQGVAGRFYAAATAALVGDVQVGEDASLWHFCSARGDVAPIRIGRRVNVQDGSVLHCAADEPLIIEDDAAIGHQATVHCSLVSSGVLIGSRAVVLDGSRIGPNSIVAAGALVAPGTEVPEGSVVMGVPGKVVRAIRDEEIEYIRRVVSGYVRLAKEHVAGKYPPIVGTEGAS